jgi:hypothetical protein
MRIVSRDEAISRGHAEFGKRGGDALQAKLEAKLGEAGEHEYRAALGKLGGDAT